MVPYLETIAKRITSILPDVKSGPLRLWGQSFGRPGENAVTITGCEATHDCLRFSFTNDEVLAVWNPADVEVDASTFRIGSATAIRWTEYCCWPKTPENIRYWDFALEDTRVAYRTNEDRIPGSGWLDGSTTSSNPAVEISESY
jgi:hypothetical protein